MTTTLAEVRDAAGPVDRRGFCWPCWRGNHVKCLRRLKTKSCPCNDSSHAVFWARAAVAPGQKSSGARNYHAWREETSLCGLAANGPARARRARRPQTPRVCAHCQRKMSDCPRGCGHPFGKHVPDPLGHVVTCPVCNCEVGR